MKKTEKSSQKLLLEEIQKRSKELNSFINQDEINPATRERLQEQLVWLRYQIKHHEVEFDEQDIKDRFNWVINNFNENLNLEEEERFSEIHE